MMQFINKNNVTLIDILEKSSIKKKRLKKSILLENNQPVPQCLVKRKNTDRVTKAEM